MGQRVDVTPMSVGVFSCAYRLFVYDVDGRLRDPTFNKTDTLLADQPVRRVSHGLELHAVGQFALGHVVYRRALRSACRTRDATRATLFFIPAFSARFFQGHTRVRPATALWTSLELVRPDGNVSALRRRNGRDHFIVQPRNGAYYERQPFFELNYNDRRLRETTRLSIETPGSNYSRYRAEPFYRGIPFPSEIRRGQPWRSAHPRFYAVAVALNPHGTYRRMRRDLRAECVRHKAMCLMGSVHRAIDAYWNATFCVQPPGDAISRRGVIDSILSGCIPILYHRAQLAQWPWHWGDWGAHASLLVENYSQTFAIVKSVPVERVEAMRRTLVANAHRLVYREDDAVDDAFDVTMRALSALSAPRPISVSVESSAS